jgi:hypothetical protein
MAAASHINCAVCARQLLDRESLRARAHLIAGKIAAMPGPAARVPTIEMLAAQHAKG